MSEVFVVGCLRMVVTFFFFKQKTAYEMRISDWSSDVCSSDLSYFLNKLGRYASALVLGALCAAVAAPAQAERIKDLASIQGVRANQLIGYGLVVGLDGSGDQVRQTPFTQQSLTNMLSQLGVTRSEEHTSELQSLMRISYA